MSKATLPKLPYTPPQVAKMYGLGTETIYREIRAGRLKARHKKGQRKRWYITEQDLVDWVEKTMFEDEEGDGD